MSMKISNILKALPIILTMTLFVAIFSFREMYLSVTHERNIVESQQKFKQLSSDFKEVSDYLTNQMQSYVKYHDKYYYDVYQEELNVLKTRENIVRQLSDMGSPVNELSLIQEVLNDTRLLSKMEQRAYDLVSSGHYDDANQLVFSPEYEQQKNEIDSKLKRYQYLMNARCAAQANIAKNSATHAIIITITLILTNVLLIFATFFMLSHKIKAISAMVEIASQISRGNLDINLEKYFSNDEFGLLAMNLGSLIGTIKSLILDIDHLTKQHDQGNINATIDSTKYQGAYRKVSAGLTTMVGSYVTMINEMSVSLKSFAEGDFTVPVKHYPRDKATISIATETLRENLTNINMELNQLIKAASLGFLSERADVTKFHGDWEHICVNLNSLLETIFEKLINSAPMAYALAKNNRIVEANKYALEHLNIQLDGESSLPYENINDRHHLLETLDNNGVVNGQLIKYITRDGSVRRYNVHVSRIIHKDDYTNVLWGFDVEDDELKNDVIKRAQLDLNKVIDALPIPLHIIDAQTKTIIYCNKSYLDLFEFKASDEVLNNKVDLLFERVQSDGINSQELYEKQKIQMLNSKETTNWVFEYKTKSNKRIDAKVIGGEILYQNRPSIIEIIQDISIEKLQHDLLQNVAEREREANKLKSRFLANMSHEIRTPMNAIIGLSQIALMKDQSIENKDYFDKINTSSKNLLTIINDVLDFSKIEAEKMDLIEGQFELEDVISNAFMVASEIINSKPIEMLLDMNPDIPCLLYGDKIRLWQILKNLLDNAAKYTDSGRIILKVLLTDKNELSDDLNPEKLYIDFIVEDTGFGMDEAQLSKLFNLFEQFHNDGQYNNSGTGLGMSISKGLVELMGGNIYVESEVNVGSKFTVRIGFKEVADSPTIQETIIREELKGSQILIADDDTYALEIMKNMLEMIGVSSICVTNGPDAIQEIIAHEEKGEPFKIILLDYYLGDQSGIDIARKLKSYSLNHSKLLMVSAYSKNLLKSDILEVGFDDVIEKPFMPSLFIQSLCNTINIAKTVKKQDHMQFNNARVLLCEDNKINQYVAESMLGILGIVPFVANNGQEAIDLLEKESFHLILMDILMPIMDGHEATQIIRSNKKKYKDIPIIAMTANVMRQEVELCFSEGMNDHVEKPINFDKLFNVLLKYLPESTHGHRLLDNNIEVKETNKEQDIDVYDNNNNNNNNMVIEKPLIDEIDLINIKEGLNRFSHKKEIYFHSLRSFAQTLPDEMRSFDDAISPMYYQETVKEIHTLKGVSGNLSIHTVYTLCVDFEKTLIVNHHPNRDLYNLLNSACKNVKQMILEKIPESAFEPIFDSKNINQKGLMNVVDGDHSEFLGIMTALSCAIEDSDPSTCEQYVKKLKMKVWQNITKDELEQIYKQIEDYEFDNASKLVKSFL